ncbi:hypothetical protein OIDMADRAFT_59344 [Oidiodendron maius Zn]|uniref:Mid2 domain-containing protein n=1 Tax=Oidiodendron maius (strain Zn) TaxID=913774 RepID=A0A0C3D0W3_OIDMZ|nr:hypothetical protein OIDMADRAFT_59344 [Oidiodendron maius Zn]
MASTTTSPTTSWMPVTTAWSAPAACSSIIWGAHAPYLALNDPGYGLTVDPGLTCLPPPATTWWEQNNTATAFSIGPTIVCPQAYTTAATSIKDSSTFVACCPSLYALNTVFDHGAAAQCQSFMTEGQVVTIVVYSTFTNNNELNSAWVTAVSTVASIAVVDGIQMNGWNFVPQTTAPSSSSSGSSSMTSTGSSSSSTSITPTSDIAGTNTSNPSLQSKQASGLSVGAKVGISVACVLVGLAIIVAALLYFISKNRGSNRNLLSETKSSASVDAAQGLYTPPPPAQEMHAPAWRAEMMAYGGHQERAELADRLL